MSDRIDEEIQFWNEFYYMDFNGETVCECGNIITEEGQSECEECLKLEEPTDE